MTNFEVLQEYEKAGVPLPRLYELQALKEENKNIKEDHNLLCNSYIENDTILKNLLKKCYSHIDRKKNGAQSLLIEIEEMLK